MTAAAKSATMMMKISKVRRTMATQTHCRQELGSVGLASASGGGAVDGSAESLSLGFGLTAAILTATMALLQKCAPPAMVTVRAAKRPDAHNIVQR
jgi:hypothetical protein